MKPRALLWLLAAVVGVLMLASARALSLWKATETGIPSIDRFRWTVARELVKQDPTASPAMARAVMAIIKNESGGRPAPVIGDAKLSGGPSVGPMQVYRRTALDLGLWRPPPDLENASEAEQRDAYARMAQSEDACISWGVSVFLEKLRIAGGDVEDAIRRYNGGGSAAAAYRDRALAFVNSTWGSLYPEDAAQEDAS